MADRDRSSAAFRRFIDRACGSVDEFGRIDDMAQAKTVPLEQLSDGLLLTLLNIGLAKKLGRDAFMNSFEGRLLHLIRGRQYKDRLARRADLERSSQTAGR